MRNTAMFQRVILGVALVAMAGCGATVPQVEYLIPTPLGELPPLEAIPSDPNLQAFTLRGGRRRIYLVPATRLRFASAMWK